jgi:hypothetical protein
MKISATDIDPQLKELFEHMATLMGSDYTTMTSSVAYDGAGSNLSLQCTEAGTGNTMNVNYRINGTRISVTPFGANLGPGETVQFTASAFNPDGTPIADAQFIWTMSGHGSVTSSGLYAAPTAIASPITDTIRCALNGTNSWTQVLVSLHP